MRVAIVTGIVVPHDAISAAVCEQARLVCQVPGIESVSVFAQVISRDLTCPGHLIQDAWSLVTNSDFMACDVAIFHWGIRYGMFDAFTLLVGMDAGPRPVVHFHNCTPRDLVSEDSWPLIDESVRQIEHVVGLGVDLWTYSEFNRRTLLALGAGADRIAFVPIPVEAPAYFPSRPRSGNVELLAVGRRVPAKGLHVLIEALGLLGKGIRDSIRLRVVGSAQFSDLAYQDQLERLIERFALHDIVQFIEGPSDAELWELYATSDVVVSPSFHEGLCVPIIEGYAFGCRAIGTTAGNLPFVVQPPDTCVEPGNAAALALAIDRMVGEVASEPKRGKLHAEFIDQYSFESTRTHLQIELCRQAPRSATGCESLHRNS